MIEEQPFTLSAQEKIVLKHMTLEVPSLVKKDIPDFALDEARDTMRRYLRELERWVWW